MPQRNLRTVVLLRGRELADRLRGSLFALPAALIIAGGVLANGIAAVDKAGTPRLPSELRIAPEAAQTLLATIAGATITTTGVVFSIMVVSVQLASGQFSPRVIRGFFRDRNGQVVVGVLVATFAFCVITLYDVSPTGEGAIRSPSVGVGIAVVLALASVLLIVRFLDHSARSLYVGNLAERISAETIAVVHVLHRAGRRTANPPRHPPDTRRRRAPATWWELRTTAGSSR